MCFKSASKPPNHLKRRQIGFCYLAESKLVLSRHWAMAVETGICCSKCPFSRKDGDLMNSVEPTFIPCEGSLKIPKWFSETGIVTVKRLQTRTRSYICLSCSVRPLSPHSAFKTSRYVIKSQIFVGQSGANK